MCFIYTLFVSVFNQIITVNWLFNSPKYDCGFVSEFSPVIPPGWRSERFERAAWRLFQGRPDCGSGDLESSPTVEHIQHIPVHHLVITECFVCLPIKQPIRDAKCVAWAILPAMMCHVFLILPWSSWSPQACGSIRNTLAALSETAAGWTPRSADGH